MPTKDRVTVSLPSPRPYSREFEQHTIERSRKAVHTLYTVLQDRLHRDQTLLRQPEVRRYDRWQNHQTQQAFADVVERLRTTYPLYYLRVDLESPDGERVTYYLARSTPREVDLTTHDAKAAHILSWSTPLAHEFVGNQPETVLLDHARWKVHLIRYFLFRPQADALITIEDRRSTYAPHTVTFWQDAFLARRVEQLSQEATQSILDTVTKHQRTAIYHPSKTRAVLIQGGPGSGKTQLGVIRLARMVLEEAPDEPFAQAKKMPSALVLTPTPLLLDVVQPILQDEYALNTIQFQTMDAWIQDHAPEIPQPAPSHTVPRE